MRDWKLKNGSPLSLTIAADARLCTPDYWNDQVWCLKLGGGEPPALAWETSYGLRARKMRIFPSFLLNRQSITDPADFHHEPLVKRVYPNFVELHLRPFAGIEVQADTWVPQSDGLCGRLVIRNLLRETVDAGMRLHAVLRPLEGGESMGEQVLGGVRMLGGKTANLHPVLFMGGGALTEPAAYPALALRWKLRPGEQKTVFWGQSAAESPAQAANQARNWANSAWDGVIARLEMVNAHVLEFETGDPEWDAALLMSQNAALRSFIGPTHLMRSASFVLNRGPDSGYSQSRLAEDFPSQWSGQDAANACVLLPQVQYSAPQLGRGVIRNFIDVQRSDGSIDMRPGMAGQRGGRLCMPLLAGLAWELGQAEDDPAFLSEVFADLLAFARRWFSAAQDQDGDGYPEWQDTIQSGFEDWPAFLRWGDHGQALDIRLAETPDLASYLCQECGALIAIARMVGREDCIAELEAHQNRLRAALDEVWSPYTGCYHQRDRDLHLTGRGARLGLARGAHDFEIRSDFDPAVRIIISFKGPEDHSAALRVTIQGLGLDGAAQEESFAQPQVQWFWERGSLTSELVYSRIERVVIDGLDSRFRVELRTADYSRQDISALLPLWAGIPDVARAEALVKKTLLDPDRFWRMQGIASVSAKDPHYRPDDAGAGSVRLWWNTMLGKGLIAYGYHQQAAELVSRLMRAAISALKQDQAFHACYHPDQQALIGEREHTGGLAPLDLLMATLGLRLISPRKIWLRGASPYPWPITIRWRGVELLFESRRSVVTFANQQRRVIEGPELRLVELRPAAAPQTEL